MKQIKFNGIIQGNEKQLIFAFQKSILHMIESIFISFFFLFEINNNKPHEAVK